MVIVNYHCPICIMTALKKRQSCVFLPVFQPSVTTAMGFAYWVIVFKVSSAFGGAKTELIGKVNKIYQLELWIVCRAKPGYAKK